MKDFHLEPRDEYPHKPDTSINFNESVFVNAYDPARRVGGWMRLGNRANEGHAEMQVCIYLPGNRIACQFQRPEIASHENFAAGGLEYEVVEPFKRIKMSYEGELLLLDSPDMLRDAENVFKNAPKVRGAVTWDHTGISPMHGGMPTSDKVEPLYGRNFSLAHFNQHTRAVGTIRVGDEEWKLDGWGWRDHSWGPRYWQNIYFHRLFMINFPDGRGAMLLKITDPAGRTRRLGVLLVAGEYEEVVDMDVTTDWTEQQEPRVSTIIVRTAKRSAIITGRIITGAPLRNRRKMDEKVLVSRIFEAFSEFTWDGVVGYGQTEYIERVDDGRLVGYPL